MNAVTTPAGGKPSGNGISSPGGGKSGGLGGHVYSSSVSKGGSFANSIISTVATGNFNSTGSITGDKASEALHSYMGYAALEPGAENVPHTSLPMVQKDFINDLDHHFHWHHILIRGIQPLHPA